MRSPSFNSYWRRAGDSNPRCPFGAYSLSRRAPSASRSALRNSRSIVTKQSRMGKGKFWSDSNLPVDVSPNHLNLQQLQAESSSRCYRFRQRYGATPAAASMPPVFISPLERSPTDNRACTELQTKHSRSQQAQSVPYRSDVCDTTRLYSPAIPSFWQYHRS